ncbi:MAG: DUF615 domain-containing protein [Pseudomonadota bacterium]|nr:DUF615 domain-containing protein [Pseudomonadota bacterium]
MEEKSKSARKRDAEALQKMAIEIGKISEQRIAKLDLPDNVLKAFLEYKKMHSNGALRRQAHFIGKLLRDVDPEQLKKVMASL